MDGLQQLYHAQGGELARQISTVTRQHFDQKDRNRRFVYSSFWEVFSGQCGLGQPVPVTDLG